MSQNKLISYRPDIDGLRAFAVLAVIAFHVLPYRFKGGFVGVDVFFVISGFLITSIIFRALETKTFSLTDFFFRRIRRIFPALICVLLFTIILGICFLLPDEKEELNWQILAGSFFSYNLLLIKETGYFDIAASQKSLLHLWSLGIEEQFYIFWPFFLGLLYKKKEFLKSAFSILFFISFGLNLYLINDHPNATFYLPLTRFWELILGGMLAIKSFPGIEKSNLKNIFSITGFLLLVCSFMLIDSKVQFPGWAALLPTLGAVFIIVSGPGAWINKRILSHPLVIYIGLISYPLYLWHWPVIYWILKLKKDYNYFLQFSHHQLELLIIILTFVAAILTYKLVESPLKKINQIGKHTIVLGSIVLVFMPIVSFYFLVKVPSESPLKAFMLKHDLVNPISTYRLQLLHDYKVECSFYGLQGEVKQLIPQSCYKPRQGPLVMLWGDSHIQHLRPGLEATLKDASLIQITSGSCSPSFQTNPDQTNGEKACNLANNFAMKKIQELKPNIVIIAQAQLHIETDWGKLTQNILNLGAKHVIIVGPAPRWKSSLPRHIGLHYWPKVPRYESHNVDRTFYSIDEEVKSKTPIGKNVSFISPISFFCSQEDGCLVYVGEDHTDLTSHDSGHLTPNASILFAKNKLAPIVNNVLFEMKDR